jgi:hypothetical protein
LESTCALGVETHHNFLLDSPNHDRRLRDLFCTSNQVGENSEGFCSWVEEIVNSRRTTSKLIKHCGYKIAEPGFDQRVFPDLAPHLIIHNLEDMWLTNGNMGRKEIMILVMVFRHDDHK